MTDKVSQEISEQFSKEFVITLSTGLSEGSGASWSVSEAPDEEATPDGSNPVRTKLVFGGKLSGEMLLELSGREAAQLVAHLVSDPDSEFGTEHSEALLKTISRAAKVFCTAQAQKYGRFTLSALPAAEPLSSPFTIANVSLLDGDGNRISIRMFANRPLAQSLALSVANESNAIEAVVSDALVGDGAQGTDPVNLDLVMDVELNVTLRFGKRMLTLREVLELTSGSVVELDRQVEEPVELLLDGRVIARGEAVVIDGNYGLRVTEVPQPISASMSQA